MSRGTSGPGAGRAVRRRVVALLGGAVVGAVVGGILTGCTPSGDAQAPEEPGRSSQRPTEPTDEAPLVGPLEALLSTVFQGDDELSEADLARLERSEEITAACMAEQGFDYVPTDWRARAGAEAGGAAVGTDDPIAFAAEYGYGVFTTEALAAQLGDPGPAAGDPNAEQLAAMSSAEEQAWYLALWGPGQGEEYFAGEEPYDWTKYGCGGRAAHETGTDDVAVFDDSAWQDLRDQIAVLEETVLTHPDLADTQAAWIACMEDAGHPGYTTINDPMAELMRRAEAIWTEAGQGVQLDLSTDDYLTDPAYLAQQAEIAERSAEMVEMETALAVADHTCRAETGYEERAAQVWFALQEEFYAAHRADLDAWLAAFEEFHAPQA